MTRDELIKCIRGAPESSVLTVVVLTENPMLAGLPPAIGFWQSAPVGSSATVKAALDYAVWALTPIYGS